MKTLLVLIFTFTSLSAGAATWEKYVNCRIDAVDKWLDASELEAMILTSNDFGKYVAIMNGGYAQGDIDARLFDLRPQIFARTNKHIQTTIQVYEKNVIQITALNLKTGELVRSAKETVSGEKSTRLLLRNARYGFFHKNILIRCIKTEGRMETAGG